MKVIVKTDEYTVYQKRNQRHAVRDAQRAWVNGDAKVAILLEHKLIEAAQPKPPEPEAAEETEAPAAEAAGEEAAETPDASEAQAESGASEKEGES